jgi:hypothetical protein
MEKNKPSKFSFIQRFRIHDNLFDYEKNSISNRKTIKKIMDKMKELKEIMK